MGASYGAASRSGIDAPRYIIRLCGKATLSAVPRPPPLLLYFSLGSRDII